MTTNPARSAASRAYRLAIPLSIASASLGLGRELLILHKLGLSATADLLQFYLSVTYTISLLGDAMRLAALNLLQGGRLGTALRSTAVVAVLTGVPITLWYVRRGPTVEPWLIGLAGVAGILNLLTVVLLVHRQRAGRFLPAHLVTVLPNVMIFTGVALALLANEATFLRVVVGLFLAAPILQLVLLMSLQTPPQEHGAGPGVLAGMGQIGLHGLGTVGAQAGQVLIRTSLATMAPGMLTIFVLLSRAVDTVRAVLLDTFIGARLAEWAAGRGTLPTLLDPRRLPLPLLAGILAVTAGAAVGAHAASGPVAVAPWLVAILLPGAWLAFVQRAGYFHLNAQSTPRALIIRLGLVDLAVAAALAAATLVAGVPAMALVWSFFVARLALQVLLMRGLVVADVRH